MAAAWFLVMVASGLGLATAGPVPSSKPHSTGRGCDIGKFEYLPPMEWKAFKKAKDALMSTYGKTHWKIQSCSSCLFPRPWTLTQLHVWERPVALEAELALTVKVLETVADSSLEDILDQPLHTLHCILSEVQACVSALPTSGSRPLLQHWLNQLQRTPKKVSQECLEATATFNLFRLLKQDLNYITRGDLCIWEPKASGGLWLA
ncbi:interferon lambda-1-like [Phyllostomus hastatus]|uniref:interferon lambda-1-like n=1 Tax=Phyllostomus hastatus TaxID=9423 RepID=UPI001E681007|nr:interferon lambda-1-like [Phyllostomus hastatus]